MYYNFSVLTITLSPTLAPGIYLAMAAGVGLTWLKIELSITRVSFSMGVSIQFTLLGFLARLFLWIGLVWIWSWLEQIELNRGYPRTSKMVPFLSTGGSTSHKLHLGLVADMTTSNKKATSQSKSDRSLILHHFLPMNKPWCSTAVLQSVHHKAPKLK